MTFERGRPSARRLERGEIDYAVVAGSADARTIQGGVLPTTVTGGGVGTAVQEAKYDPARAHVEMGYRYGFAF